MAALKLGFARLLDFWGSLTVYTYDRQPDQHDADAIASDWKHVGGDIRVARRPKPPSLKEQALDALNLMLMFIPPGNQHEQGEAIRRALEQLSDDQG